MKGKWDELCASPAASGGYCPLAWCHRTSDSADDPYCERHGLGDYEAAAEVLRTYGADQLGASMQDILIELLDRVDQQRVPSLQQWLEACAHAPWSNKMTPQANDIQMLACTVLGYTSTDKGWPADEQLTPALLQARCCTCSGDTEECDHLMAKDVAAALAAWRGLAND